MKNKLIMGILASLVIGLFFVSGCANTPEYCNSNKCGDCITYDGSKYVAGEIIESFESETVEHYCQDNSGIYYWTGYCEGNENVQEQYRCAPSGECKLFINKSDCNEVWQPQGDIIGGRCYELDGWPFVVCERVLA